MRQDQGDKRKTTELYDISRKSREIDKNEKIDKIKIFDRSEKLATSKKPEIKNFEKPDKSIYIRQDDPEDSANKKKAILKSVTKDQRGKSKSDGGLSKPDDTCESAFFVTL